MTGCRRCPELTAARTQVVTGVLPAGARLALVGEAPGASEDTSGRPFEGAAGRLLSRLLAEVGIERSAVAVLNTLGCRPPGNRRPARAELAACAGWVHEQLAAADPAVICALGRTAAVWFLGERACRGVSIAQLRSAPLGWQGRALVVTYHPAAALRAGPAGSRWEDLRADLARAGGLARGAAEASR